MKIIKYILIISAALLLNACDFLDQSSKEITPELYFNTEAELESFLVGTYSPIMQERFYGNDYPLNLSSGDDLTYYQRENPINSIICANANSGTQEILTFWRILYVGVDRANQLLENIDKNEEISIKLRDKIRAEAKFLRAFYYFNLVQGWGDVPLRKESAKGPNGLAMARTPKSDIYDFIIKELEESIANLPTSAQMKSTGTATQSAAQGLLARIYLFRAGEPYRDGKLPGADESKYFEKAAFWANEVKDSHLHGLVKPYSRVFIDLAEDKYNSTGVRESIWEAEMQGSRATADQSAGRIGNVIGFGQDKNDYSTNTSIKNSTGMQNPGYSYRFAFASLKAYDMYEEAGDKVRGDWNIAPYEYTYNADENKTIKGREYFFGKMPDVLEEGLDGYVIEELTAAKSVNKTRSVAKYRREYEQALPKHKNSTPINFPILRYSDVLLMLAEAENEANGFPTPLAYECINAVRDRAELDPIPAGLSVDDFRKAVKTERALELSYEALRRWDLIRWGEYYTTMRAMPNNVSQPGWAPGHRYAANYYKITPAYVYFPIPDWERSTNRLVTQNPGW